MIKKKGLALTSAFLILGSVQFFSIAQAQVTQCQTDMGKMNGMLNSYSSGYSVSITEAGYAGNYNIIGPTTLTNNQLSQNGNQCTLTNVGTNAYDIVNNGVLTCTWTAGNWGHTLTCS